MLSYSQLQRVTTTINTTTKKAYQIEMQDIQQTNQVSKEQKNQRIENKFFKMQADRTTGRSSII